MREMLKLPQGGVVFACFNNSYKITPSYFDAWLAIYWRCLGVCSF